MTGLKKREREILESLGVVHRHTVNHDEQQASQDDKCILCGVERYQHWQSIPSLSDPGVFWPMFEEWRSRWDRLSVLQFAIVPDLRGLRFPFTAPAPGEMPRLAAKNETCQFPPPYARNATKFLTGDCGVVEADSKPTSEVIQ